MDSPAATATVMVTSTSSSAMKAIRGTTRCPARSCRTEAAVRRTISPTSSGTGGRARSSGTGPFPAAPLCS